MFNTPASLAFVNPWLTEVANRPSVAVISLGTGGLFGGCVAYWFALEFWQRARPTKIDPFGITTYFVGRSVSVLPWADIISISKICYANVAGDPIEKIWLQGREAKKSQLPPEIPSDMKTLSRMQLLLYPPRGVWLTNFMNSRTQYRNACHLLTYYARRNGIPMRLCDTRPSELQKARRELTPEVYRQQVKGRGVVTAIDKL
jgi:hypothetical protein